MVRADGDALVMHVGERPYVVTPAGPLDLSTHGLNLGAMSGMLQQLLPADAQNSLEEFGAVEHQLPSVSEDRFTLVAARGGDDIWIEIRRRRAVPAAGRAPVPVDEPVAVQEAAPQPAYEEIPVPEPIAEPEPPPPVPVEADVPVFLLDDAPVVQAVAPGDAPIVVEEPSPLAIPVEVEAPAVASAESAPWVERSFPVQEPAVLEAPIELVAAAEVSAFGREDSGERRRDLGEAAFGRDVSALVAPVAPVAPVEPVEPVSAPSPRAVIPMTRTVRIDVPSYVLSQSRASTVDRLLRLAAARGAVALFLSSESRPYIRVEGDIRLLDGEALLSKAEVEAAVMEIVPEEAQESVGSGEAIEWITELPELGRIRCTSFRDHRGPGVLFRMIATRAATAEQLGLPREVQALATETQGLVLVAGSRGSGKSTLMSALVDLVNRQRAEYVITLERQIRLVHDNRSALVSQREIRGGTDEALAAARAALRENPDVLVVDDLSSAQMVPLLLEAATEGLLVFVSITAPSTADAVERLIDLATPEMRAAVQAAMAESFRGAVSQVMLKKNGGGRVVAREIMLATAAVTRLIGDGQLGQLPLALESGRRHGMVPMTDVLVGLVQSGVVDVREAFRKTHDRDRLLAGLKREGVDTSVVERLA